MHKILMSLALCVALTGSAFAGEAEIKAAQGVVDSQLKALKAGDGVTAYSFASPTIQRMFPTPDAFMAMVTTAYQPVRNPQSYSFGKSEETSATTVAQQVMIVGPDGKNYEAMYTIERQADGTYKITGCSLKASNSLTT